MGPIDAKCFANQQSALQIGSARFAPAAGSIEPQPRIGAFDAVVAHHEELLERCETALAINPGCANAVFFKALVLAKLGREDEATAVLSLDRYVQVSAPDIPPESVPAEKAPDIPAAPPERVGGAAAIVSAADSISGTQASPEAEPAPPPRRTPARPPEHVVANQTVITAADPNRPKRGGWWQRAKATLTGGE